MHTLNRTQAEQVTLVAINGLYKVMAYKDEYEVARAYTDPAFRAKLDAQFEGDFKVRVKLAPPLISRRDPVTGYLKKREFGPWISTAFRLLKSLKWLRGSRLDLFGYSLERRTERALIPHYRKLLSHVTANLSKANLEVGIRLAGLTEQIKGFGQSSPFIRRCSAPPWAASAYGLMSTTPMRSMMS